ncbi:hypothetical protein [Nocardia sp. NPDC059239]|uniref:hypothetical protein n=1 Tax=unclassified Nocardia TaxID=2637762 RepID=UPI0036A29F06
MTPRAGADERLPAQHERHRDRLVAALLTEIVSAGESSAIRIARSASRPPRDASLAASGPRWYRAVDRDITKEVRPMNDVSRWVLPIVVAVGRTN